MPQAPMLPPEAMQQQQNAAAGINPANFLIAAAQMHNEGSLSMPSGPKEPLQTGKRPPRKLRILK